MEAADCRRVTALWWRANATPVRMALIVLTKSQFDLKPPRDTDVFIFKQMQRKSNILRQALLLHFHYQTQVQVL